MRALLFTSIIVIIAIGSIWWFPAGNVRITQEQKQTLDALSFQNYLKANYSFSRDSDLDGLSDAKEIIYGANPLNPDTDGDGYSDGQEAAAGFDPLVPGKARLEDRKNLSISIQYFTWLQKETGNPDPQLDSLNIEKFLTQKGLLSFSLKPVLEYDIHFTNDDPKKIADYLTLTNSLNLPEQGSPYLAFAGRLIGNQSFSELATLLKTLDSQLAQLKNAQVPPSLVELHRSYAGIWQELQTIFNDLKHVQDDPVLIFLDEKKGEWLVKKIKETEVLRANLIAQFKLLPFTQHGLQTPTTPEK